jgi:hypothetical protein
MRSQCAFIQGVRGGVYRLLGPERGVEGGVWCRGTAVVAAALLPAAGVSMTVCLVVLMFVPVVTRQPG